MEYETMWGEVTRRTDEREHYHDRWARAVANRLELGVYVPALLGVDAMVLGIDAASGIVGSPGPAVQLTIDYEGNRFGSENMRSWANRVHHAAGRHVSVYPTVARSFVEAGQMHRVGTYHVDDDTITVDDMVAVRAWVAGEDTSEWIITNTGRVLTDAAVWRLSREAERGYDVSKFKARPPRKR